MQHPNSILTLGTDRFIAQTIQTQAQHYINQSKSENTTRAYKSDWKHFEQWCTANNLSALPTAPSVLIQYLTTFAETHSVSTLSRRLTTIREAHKAAGFETAFMNDPVLKALWEGVKRTNGTAQHGKDPLLTEDIRALVNNLPKTIKGIRDRAVLMLGFAGAFRRSELVGLDVSDLLFTSNGIEVALRRSKTDQSGKGMTKAIPYGSNPELCPVRAVQAWIEQINRTDGPLFVRVGKSNRLTDERLSGRAVALIIKEYAEQAHLDVGKYSGHSLRSGFVTQAAKNGATDREIMNQTAHKSRAMVDRYVRNIRIWENNAAARLGL